MIGKPLRIALVFEFGSLNGGEHSMLAVIDQLRGGVDFTALAPAEGPLSAALQSRGIRTIPLDVRDSHGQRRPRDEVLSELREKLNAAGGDVVHANSLSMGRLMGALANGLPMPVVAHLRDIIKLSRTAIADLNRCTRLVAVSEATREFHIAQGLQPERVVRIYNGVDCERFQPRPDDGSLRREWNLTAADFLVLTVGQIGLRKGQDVLAKAAWLLSDRLPQAHYLLAGQRCSEKQESRDFEAQVFAQLGSIGAGHHLHRLGYRDDLPRLMNAADVLVHPAHQEPLGRVLLEAAASGLPIIATDVGGTAEILTHGQSALLIPPADPEALAEAIFKLAEDPPLRKQLALQAREQILQNFSIPQAAQNLLALWRELMMP